MSCNSCAKPYHLFRKEKGCPGCGFSYCSKCLDNKIFLKKINSEAKVCSKCKHKGDSEHKKDIVPPDAYYKRIGVLSKETSNSNASESTGKTVEEDIQKRLQQLKPNKNIVQPSDDEIMKRLQKIRGSQHAPTDVELQSRLAKLRDTPVFDNESKPLYKPDHRTEQEQADNLLDQFLEQTNIDKQYKKGFDEQLDNIEKRILNLKGASGGTSGTASKRAISNEDNSETDDESEIKKILDKVKAESLISDEDISPEKCDELPFCEICNEDATMRCLGCRYLFCKRCFIDHKDDDDGCNRYELYEPPKRK